MTASTTGRLSSRALIEEDDIINQRLLGLVLRRAGFQVDVVPSSDTAIAAVAADDYDLVVVDYARLGLRALATAWAIRRLPTSHDTRIVAVAPTATATERASCHEAGIDDVITDPRELDNIARSTRRRAEQQVTGTLTALTSVPAVDPAAVLAADIIVQLDELPMADRRELVSMIDQRTTELLVQISSALTNDDTTAAAVATHRLEGIAVIVGAGRLSRHSTALLGALQAEQIDDARTLAAALIGEQAALANELYDQVIVDPPPRQSSCER